MINTGFWPWYYMKHGLFWTRVEELINWPISYMKNTILFLAAILVLVSCTTTKEKAENNMVRVSKITVDQARLHEYNAFLKEEIEASMLLEPGVLVLYAVSEKKKPNRITILEIYADEDAYKKHLSTPHFLKYKEGTNDMVQSLELIDTHPLIPGLKIK